ncbi:hypothetical protein CGRA01v4_00637 [Colletotrichum graminicola]|nr:hypothetical protein CGRA01v4_00637 [Colletotrichum graminicola]
MANAFSVTTLIVARQSTSVAIGKITRSQPAIMVNRLLSLKGSDNYRH